MQVVISVFKLPNNAFKEAIDDEVKNLNIASSSARNH
jgi:hypothetical protein